MIQYIERSSMYDVTISEVLELGDEYSLLDPACAQYLSNGEDDTYVCSSLALL